MRIRLLGLLALIGITSFALAERVPKGQDELKKEATHIVTGVLKTKYGKDVVTDRMYGAGTVITDFVVEIEIEKVEKGGDDLKANDLVYGRAWQVKKRGALGLVPGPSGHHIPADGQKVRVYMVRGTKTPKGEGDRGYGICEPNGVEVIAKPK